MNKKLLNTQIEALSIEHGAEIVELYKMNGFDTNNFQGLYSKKGKEDIRWYGVDNEGFFRVRMELQDKLIKTITLEQAKQLVSTKDFSKMDMEEWLIKTEKLGLSEDELIKHIGGVVGADFDKIYSKLEGTHSADKAKILFTKWNAPKSDLYTEITAYKLEDGRILESKEDAEIMAKEIYIKNSLSNYFDEDFISRIMQNLELIKQIINK